MSTIANPPESTAAKTRGWTVMRFAVAAILLVAAFLKAQQLATTPSLGDGLLQARWFNILVVEFELFFAVWLIFGMLPKLSWLACVGCFTVFASVSLFKAVAGEASCGCWGATEVNPWYMVIFDLTVVGLLIKFRPHESWTLGSNTAKQYALNYGLIVVPLCGFSFYEMSQVKFQQLHEIGQVLEQGGVVKLEPKSWVGKEFPLRNFCDVGEQITTGQWIVLLHRAGCAECREVSPLVVDLVKKRGCPLVVLEMKAGEESLNFGEIIPLTGIMSQEILWFAETPIVLELDNCLVKQVLLRDDLKRIQHLDSSHTLMFGLTSQRR